MDMDYHRHQQQQQQQHQYPLHLQAHDDAAVYPPAPLSLNQSDYMSRSTSYQSSRSSFGKKPGLMSDESLTEHGEPVPPPKQSVEKPVDAAKRWTTNLLPKSWPIRLFLATALLETIVDLAIQGDIYLRLWALTETQPDHRNDIQRVVIYLALFAFAHIVQLFLAIEAVWQQNTLQFLFLTIFNLLFFAYSIVEGIEIRNLGTTVGEGITSISIQVLTIVSPVVIGISEIAFVAIGWQIWKEFGWKVYKFLGADRRIRRIFFHYQVFLSLLRFDFFFCTGFSAQLVAFVLKNEEAEYFLTIAAVPLGVVLLVGGHFAARYENKWLMFSFMLGCVCATVYFAYKLFKIYEGIQSTYEDVVKSLTLFASVSLLFLIVTFIWGCIVMHNFGRGLKEQMSKKHMNGHRRRATSLTLDNKNFPMTTNPNRMSIE